MWAAFRSVWHELSVTLEEVVEAHGDVVVVRTRFVGRGSASGVEVDRTVFYVFELAAGKLKRLRPFDTEAEALAAAGSEGRAITDDPLRSSDAPRQRSPPTSRTQYLAAEVRFPQSGTMRGRAPHCGATPLEGSSHSACKRGPRFIRT